MVLLRQKFPRADLRMACRLSLGHNSCRGKCPLSESRGRSTDLIWPASRAAWESDGEARAAGAGLCDEAGREAERESPVLILNHVIRHAPCLEV
jgi:hypothetical protein